MAGIAVRMSHDLGLHLASRPVVTKALSSSQESSDNPSSRDAKEARLDRLAFSSVLLLDYALSFGVGRCTGYRHEEITQDLAHATDFCPEPNGHRSPFPFAARMMLAYAPVIDILNLPRGDCTHLAHHMAAAVREYNTLPDDMQWNVTK